MFPLFDRHRPGGWLKDLSADWFNTVARILNDISGVGIRIAKPAGGLGWTLTVLTDGTTLQLNPQTGVLQLKAGGVGTSYLADGAVTTAKIADANVTAAKIATAVAGNGLTGGGGSALAVNVDNSTIEISSDSLRVKGNGIGTGQMSSGLYSGSVSLLTPATLNFTNGVLTSVS